jgi:hypothetical protein
MLVITELIIQTLLVNFACKRPPELLRTRFAPPPRVLNRVQFRLAFKRQDRITRGNRIWNLSTYTYSECRYCAILLKIPKIGSGEIRRERERRRSGAGFEAGATGFLCRCTTKEYSIHIFHK